MGGGPQHCETSTRDKRRCTSAWISKISRFGTQVCTWWYRRAFAQGKNISPAWSTLGSGGRASARTTCLRVVSLGSGLLLCFTAKSKPVTGPLFWNKPANGTSVYPSSGGRVWVCPSGAPNIWSFETQPCTQEKTMEGCTAWKVDGWNTDRVRKQIRQKTRLEKGDCLLLCEGFLKSGWWELSTLGTREWGYAISLPALPPVGLDPCTSAKLCPSVENRANSLRPSRFMSTRARSPARQWSRPLGQKTNTHPLHAPNLLTREYCKC